MSVSSDSDSDGYLSEWMDEDEFERDWRGRHCLQRSEVVTEQHRPRSRQPVMALPFRPTRWARLDRPLSLSSDALSVLFDAQLKTSLCQFFVLARVCKEWREAAATALRCLMMKFRAATARARELERPFLERRALALDTARRATVGMRVTEGLAAMKTAVQEQERCDLRRQMRKQNCGALIWLLRDYGVPGPRWRFHVENVSCAGWFPDFASVIGTLLGGCEVCGRERSPHPKSMQKSPWMIPACWTCMWERAATLSLAFSHRHKCDAPINKFTIDDLRVYAERNATRNSQMVGDVFGEACVERARRLHPAKSGRFNIAKCDLLFKWFAQTNTGGVSSGWQFPLLWALPPPLAPGQPDSSLCALLRISPSAHDLAVANHKRALVVAAQARKVEASKRLEELVERVFDDRGETNPRFQLSLRGIAHLRKCVPFFSLCRAMWAAWPDWSNGPVSKLVGRLSTRGYYVGQSDKRVREFLARPALAAELEDRVRKLWMVYYRIHSSSGETRLCNPGQQWWSQTHLKKASDIPHAERIENATERMHTAHYAVLLTRTLCCTGTSAHAINFAELVETIQNAHIDLTFGPKINLQPNLHPVKIRIRRHNQLRRSFEYTTAMCSRAKSALLFGGPEEGVCHETTPHTTEVFQGCPAEADFAEALNEPDPPFESPLFTLNMREHRSSARKRLLSWMECDAVQKIVEAILGD